MLMSRVGTIIPVRAMATKVPKPPTSSVTETPKTDQTPQQKLDNRNNYTGVGYKADKDSRDIYLNPLLTPPPRGPSSAEDFRHPWKIGHWYPYGFDFADKVRDRYMFHECVFYFVSIGLVCVWVYAYSPDLKDREWARREAFLRTHKREALGLPLIDPNVVDPDRIVLPTEEELGDFPVTQ